MMVNALAASYVEQTTVGEFLILQQTVVLMGDANGDDFIDVPEMLADFQLLAQFVNVNEFYVK